MKKVVLLSILCFVLQILSAQTPPVAINDSITINKNNSVTVPVLANDYDIDGDPLSITILTATTNGTVSVQANTVSYTPNQNFVGVDSFQYIICDTTSLCDTGWAFIIITGNNNAPSANNDFYTVPENSVTTLPVNSNDQDPDGEPLSIALITPPLHGSASSINGNQILYTPYANYFGNDTLSYVICDTSGLCDTALVFVTVTGANAAPVAVDDNFTYSDTLNAVLLNVIGNDFDPEGDSISITTLLDQDSLNNLGTLVFTNPGEVGFIRTSLACGSETFSYVLCDASLCDTAFITVIVNCPDDIFHTQGFSPDGDGLNDKLVFTSIEYFAPAAIKVYNRYGNLVYENEDYKNDWDGTNLDKGKALPDGTYYYILKLGNGRSYNNYLIINR